MQHFLVARAHVYQANRIHGPIDGAIYDASRGAWALDGAQFLVKSCSRSAVLPGTKKSDRETGEDQKGE